MIIIRDNFETGGVPKPHIHWLKIRGLVTAREEAEQYKEIQSYLDRYPESIAMMYRYEASLCDYVVRLECNQDWKNLDLYANSGFHALKRLTRKPNNIGNPEPFATPERLAKISCENYRHKNYEER